MSEHDSFTGPTSPHHQSVDANDRQKDAVRKCVRPRAGMNLWLPFLKWLKWVCGARGSWGFCTLTPAIDPHRAPAESSGRREQGPFDQTVVMTSQRSANLPLNSGNSVKVPQGIKSITVRVRGATRGVGSADLCSVLITPRLKVEGSVVSVPTPAPQKYLLRNNKSIHNVH